MSLLSCIVISYLTVPCIWDRTIEQWIYYQSLYYYGTDDQFSRESYDAGNERRGGGGYLRNVQPNSGFRQVVVDE